MVHQDWKCFKYIHQMLSHHYFNLLEHPNSSFNDPNGINVFLLLGFIVGALYLLGSNGDPVPEITWNTFLREMLTTGEVRCNFI